MLALGGPTNLTITGPSMISGTSPSPIVGVASRGNVTLTGPSSIQAKVYLGLGDKVSLSGQSFTSWPVEQDSATDTFLNKARTDALSAAHCMAMLSPTITNGPQSINITNPSNNVTIHANNQVNVINFTDLILTNGTLTLTSNGTSCGADPGCSGPTLIINISGRFQISGGSKIVLTGGLDEVHVIYNVVGTGNVQFSGGANNGVPNSQITGVLFAPYRSVDLAPGLVNGAVIAGGSDITLTSGAKIISHFNIDP